MRTFCGMVTCCKGGWLRNLVSDLIFWRTRRLPPAEHWTQRCRGHRPGWRHSRFCQVAPAGRRGWLPAGWVIVRQRP